MECVKLLKDPEALDMHDNALLIQSLKTSVKSALVEKFLEGNERPCDKNDFLDSKKKREKLITSIKLSIENLVKSHFFKKINEERVISHCYSDIDKELLTLVIVLCGQNSSVHFWNTEVTVKNCETILSEILKLFNCKDISELISGNVKINLVKNILQILCTDLTVSTWKYFPASVVCYKWILEIIKQPELGQYLQFVLPPALLLIDDFVTENRIIGAHCLNHIVQNITIAELQLYGHGDVIYSALLPLLRIREAELINSVMLPLVSVTTKLEFDLGKRDSTKWSKFDNILEIFLENMELEQMIDLRNCYINNLNLLISASGQNIIRWSKRLLRIFDEYIQTAGKYNDEKIINRCVMAIENYIKFTREISFMYAKHLLFTLLIALYSTKSYKSEMKEIIIKSIKEMLQSMSEIEKENLENDFKKNLMNNVDLCMIYKQLCEINNYIDGAK